LESQDLVFEISVRVPIENLTKIQPRSNLATFHGWNVVMGMSLTFRHGQDIDQREAGVSILQKYWKAFAPRDVYDWSQRIANSGDYVVVAYVGNAIAGVLEAIRLDIRGDPHQVPTTFQKLTADGTWKTHKDSGDTVLLVDLTIAPDYQGAGLFEDLALYARRTFESPSGVMLTYSPLFLANKKYWVLHKNERLGGKLTRELRRSRPGLTMIVGGEELSAEDVGIMAYIESTASSVTAR
jgi:hypothetical protein